MGLSALAFIAAAGILVVIAFLARRSLRQAATRMEILVDFFLAVFAVFQGLAVYATINPPEPNIAIFYLRASYASRAVVEFLLVAFALFFPKRLNRAAPPLAACLVAAAAAIAWYILTGLSYVQDWMYTDAAFIVVPGEAFQWVNLGMTAVGLAAAGIHLGRAIGTADSINRERSLLAFAAVFLGVVTIQLYQDYSITHLGEPWPIIAPAFIAFAMSAINAYATSISRLFDWREFGKTLLAYTALTLLAGLPAAAIVALLVVLGSRLPLLPWLGTPLVFILAYGFGKRFSARFTERLGSRGEYREMLESALAQIDLSEGRDAVLGKLHSVLSDELGFTDLTILIEDDRGALRTGYSSSTAHASLDKANALRAHLEATEAEVLMLSEAQADPRHEAVQKELLALFSDLRAEALIFAREGRRIIGVFAIGPRKIGGEYTAYDYETFKAISAKLFVFAFYLKNVARESIIYTVDRELALSDQVIRFALEHVAPVEHPKADAAWAMRSTRRLGGDFVDFVRIGKERWFFVLGDVSGKGLSASMNMLILKSMIRSFLRIEKDFSSLVQRVNAFIKDYLPKGSFFAGIFGYFDFEKGAIYFINCGVPAMLLYSPAFDAFIEVQGEGKVLGFVKDISPHLRPRKLTLSPGTALVISTDGLLDSENLRGERFGKDRLKKSARERLAESSKSIADGLMADLMSYTENRQEDDITLLVMKIK
jgi:hypothetical protein